MMMNKLTKDLTKSPINHDQSHTNRQTIAIQSPTKPIANRSPTNHQPITNRSSTNCQPITNQSPTDHQLIANQPPNPSAPIWANSNQWRYPIAIQTPNQSPTNRQPFINQSSTNRQPITNQSPTNHLPIANQSGTNGKPIAN